MRNPNISISGTIINGKDFPTFQKVCQKQDFKKQIADLEDAIALLSQQIDSLENQERSEDDCCKRL